MSWEDTNRKWEQAKASFQATTDELLQSQELERIVQQRLVDLCQPMETLGFSVAYQDPKLASDAISATKTLSVEIRPHATDVRPFWGMAFDICVANGGSAVFFHVIGRLWTITGTAPWVDDEFEWASLKVNLPLTGESRGQEFIDAFKAILLEEPAAMTKWWALHTP